MGTAGQIATMCWQSDQSLSSTVGGAKKHQFSSLNTKEGQTSSFVVSEFLADTCQYILSLIVRTIVAFLLKSSFMLVISPVFLVK